MIQSGIYMWKNKITGRVLVGQTVNFNKRKASYLRSLKNGDYGNSHFQAAWNKYGQDAFEFSILEVVSNHEFLTAFEQKYVDYFRNFKTGVYNQVGPVDSPRRGAKNSTSQNAKISSSNLGKPKRKGYKKGPRSLESRQKQSAAIRGKKRRSMSEAAKAKSSATQKGRKFTAEHVANLSASLQKSEIVKEKNRRIGAAQRGVPKENLRRPVERIDLKTGEVKEYTGVKATAADGFNPSHVSAVCNGKRPTHLGFGWAHQDGDAQ